MMSKTTVERLSGRRTLAVVDVSCDLKAFANSAHRELKAKGFRLLPVNPHMETFDGERCYPSLKALPEPAGGAPSAWR